MTMKHSLSHSERLTRSLTIFATESAPELDIIEGAEEDLILSDSGSEAESD